MFKPVYLSPLSTRNHKYNATCKYNDIGKKIQQNMKFITHEIHIETPILENIYKVSMKYAQIQPTYLENLSISIP